MPPESPTPSGSFATTATSQKTVAPSRFAIDPVTFLKRTLSWIALWILALWIIFSGWDEGWLLLIALFGLAGQWEFYRAQEEKGLKVFKQSGLFCGALIFSTRGTFCSIGRITRASSISASNLYSSSRCSAPSSGSSWSTRRIAPPSPPPRSLCSASFTCPFFSTSSPSSLSWRATPEQNRFILIYLLAVTKFADVGAYVIGSLFGRNKMIPRISPGKTWEGLVGAVVTSLVISMAMTYLMGPHVPAISFTDSIVLGLLLPLVSVVGDLAESVVKRDASIKDSGRTIPGIGGALDLIDSILFTAPVLYFYLQFTSPTPP